MNLLRESTLRAGLCSNLRDIGIIQKQTWRVSPEIQGLCTSTRLKAYQNTQTKLISRNYSSGCNAFFLQNNGKAVTYAGNYGLRRVSGAAKRRQRERISLIEPFSRVPLSPGLKKPLKRRNSANFPFKAIIRQLQVHVSLSLICPSCGIFQKNPGGFF